MINYLGGLYRRLDHIKLNEDQDGGYEPTLVILNHKKKGRSFMIPLGAMWKYVDPQSYKGDDEVMSVDEMDFRKLVEENKMVAYGFSQVVIVGNNERRRKALENLSACEFAYAFSKGTGIMLCTSYNLAKCMQMFDIPPIPQAAAQLLLWVQSRLEDLKNMPENPEKEEQYVGGEAKIFVNGEYVTTKDMTVSETDLVMHDNA